MRPNTVAFVLACWAGIVPAQTQAIEISPFPGLAEAARVADFHEDDQGRLWVAFEDRVQCHDGRRVTEVRWPLDPVGQSRTLRCLTAAIGGDLWVGGSKGLWRVPNGRTTAERIEGSENLEVWDLAVASDGSAWARTGAGLVRATAEHGTEQMPSPTASTAVMTVLAAAGRIWTWTREGLFWRGAGAWHRETGAPSDLRRVYALGDRLLAVTSTGADLWRDGRWSRVYEGPEPASSIYAAVGGGSIWLATVRRFWRLDESRGTLHDVTLFQRHGDPFTEGGIWGLLVDRQGLLWLGTNAGLCRAGVAPGIDNVLVDHLQAEDHVTAICEDERGRVLLGTKNGAVLREHGAGWQTLDTPWLDDARRNSPVDTITRDATGRNWIGTRAHGLWTLQADRWERIGEQVGVRGARTILHRRNGDTWIAERTNVWNWSREGIVREVSPWASGTAVAGAPCVLLEDERATVWLGAYRAGLSRLEPDSNLFVPAGDPRFATSVTNLFHHGNEPWTLWATAPDGLFRLDLRSTTQHTEHLTSRAGMFRSGLATADGNLWLTQPSQLMHYDTRARRARTLTARLGAHPRGYSYRAQYERSNGELWFGARGGYTKIATATTPLPDWHGSVRGWAVTAAGVRLAGDDPVETVTGSGPIEFETQVVDRAADTPPAVSIVLFGERNDAAIEPTKGQFLDLPVGTYEAFTTVEDATGGAQTLRLGTLAVRRAPIAWHWLAWALVGSASIGIVLWQRLASRHHRTRRRVAVERVLTQTGRRPEQTLDIAFLAVAAAEQIHLQAQSQHSTVWMVGGKKGDRLRLAEFGTPLPTALAVTEHTTTKPRRDLVKCAPCHVHIDDPGSAPTAVICIGEGSDLEFEVLVSRMNAPLDTVLHHIEHEVHPILTALRKQSWIDQLENEWAQATAHLEAGVHDLRSPLTSLRLGTHTMLDRVRTMNDAPLVDLAEDLVEATERVVAAIATLGSSHRPQDAKVQPADPVLIVRTHLKQFREQARGKSITLRFTAPDEPPTVNLDPTWFGRVVQNLVDNAIKYSPPGSTVHVQCTRTATDFELHVDDEGPGFTAAERESVFLPGIAGTATPTAGESQTGMGLWIARQAVRSMGGRLWIEPRETGGARVALSLPLAPRAEGRKPG